MYAIHLHLTKQGGILFDNTYIVAKRNLSVIYKVLVPHYIPGDSTLFLPRKFSVSVSLRLWFSLGCLSESVQNKTTLKYLIIH